MKKAKPTLMSKMNLREQFEKETKNEWLPPFYDCQDELDAEIAFSNWLIVRDTKQAEELEEAKTEVSMVHDEIINADTRSDELRDTLHAVRNKMHESNLHATELQRQLDASQRRIDEERKCTDEEMESILIQRSR